MANVIYVDYYGKRVSRRWNRVLRAADRAGVRFHLDSGHRTIREQWALYNQNMISPGHPKPGHPMTAYPLPTAPHIRTGLAAHALDINSQDGGETRFQNWINRHGVTWRNTVSSESWHGELSSRDLRKLDRMLR
jgi:hypothetical protein